MRSIPAPGTNKQCKAAQAVQAVQRNTKKAGKPREIKGPGLFFIRASLGALLQSGGLWWWRGVLGVLSGLGCRVFRINQSFAVVAVPALHLHDIKAFVRCSASRAGHELPCASPASAWFVGAVVLVVFRCMWFHFKLPQVINR